MQFNRFANIILDQTPEKPVLREQGFGEHSAKVLGKILKTDSTIVSLDLSMNNIAQGLDSLIDGLMQNSTIVNLKLRNNNIDGRKNQD